MRPSLRAPIFTLMYEPGVGPVPSKTSLRDITIFTGRPVLLRKQRRHRLQVDRDLAAEAAADLHGRYLHARDRNVEHAGGDVAHDERALRAAPDQHAAIVVPQRGGGVRLDVALVDRGGVEFALDDHVGFGEALLDIAHAIAEVLGDVARPDRSARRVPWSSRSSCSMRRAFLHGFGRGEHAGQHFVLHFDQPGGLLGDVRG